MHGGENDIVVVGNGCAGAECIKALRECGFRESIHLLTDSRWPVANPMLTTYYAAGKIDFTGLFPYGAGQEFYHRYGVDVHAASPVTELDARRRVAAGRSGWEFKYGRCLVATGASPVLPPVEGIGSDRVFTLRTVEDARRLKEALSLRPRKAVVVGASMVGIKVVELLHRAGVEVCLADLARHVFPLAAHADCARVIEERLAEKGVRLRLGAGIAKVADTRGAVVACFPDGAEEADILVMSVGVRANTAFVDREQVAVDQGILVDECMRTSVPGLYAAGDVAQGKNLSTGRASIIGLWANARYQGRTAGRNMAGVTDVFPGSIPHNITHFMGMDFVSVGDISGPGEKHCDGRRFIQLFRKDGLLVGANLLDCTAPSGALKNALIKGLVQDKAGGAGSFGENALVKAILREVEVP